MMVMDEGNGSGNDHGDGDGNGGGKGDGDRLVTVLIMVMMTVMVVVIVTVMVRVMVTMVLACLQLERLESLMNHARLHSLPLDDPSAPWDSDDESGGGLVGVKAAQQRLQSIQQLCGTPGRTPSRTPGSQTTPSRWVSNGVFLSFCTPSATPLAGTPEAKILLPPPPRQMGG